MFVFVNYIYNFCLFPAKTRFTLIVPMAAIAYSIQIFTEVSQVIYVNFHSIVASK